MVVFTLIAFLLVRRFKLVELVSKIDNRRVFRNSLISALALDSVVIPYLYFRVWDQPPDFPFLNLMLMTYALCCCLVFLPIEIYRLKKKQN